MSLYSYIVWYTKGEYFGVHLSLDERKKHPKRFEQINVVAI